MAEQNTNYTPPVQPVEKPKKTIPTFIGIAIIVVAALVIFGGVFVWQYFVTKPSNNQTIISPATSATAGWKTYTNGEFGFSFNYPSDWILHTGSNGASVLTTQHENHNTNGPLNGTTVDFSVTACDLMSVEACLEYKNVLDATIKAYSNEGQNDLTFTIDGAKGSQWVNGADQYAYNGVIIRDGIMYHFGSTPEEYTMKYPNIADKQVKAIFDSFKFTTVSTPTDQTAGWKTYTNTQYGFEIKYPADWSYGDNLYLLAPNMVFCSPKFSDAKTGCEWHNTNMPSPKPTSNSEVALFIGKKPGGTFSINNIGMQNCQVKDENINGISMSMHNCGDRGVEAVWFGQSNSNIYNLRLFDNTEKEIFNKIISTFKFTTPTDQTEKDLSVNPTKKIVMTKNGKQIIIDNNTVVKRSGPYATLHTCTLDDICLQSFKSPDGNCYGYLFSLSVTYSQKNNLYYATELTWTPQ